MPDSAVTVTASLFPARTVMVAMSVSVGEVTGSTHNGSGVPRGQYAVGVGVEVGVGVSVSTGRVTGALVEGGAGDDGLKVGSGEARELRVEVGVCDRTGDDVAVMGERVPVGVVVVVGEQVPVGVVVVVGECVPATVAVVVGVLRDRGVAVGVTVVPIGVGVGSGDTN
jgi:hypothetical protein